MILLLGEVALTVLIQHRLDIFISSLFLVLDDEPSPNWWIFHFFHLAKRKRKKGSGVTKKEILFNQFLKKFHNLDDIENLQSVLFLSSHNQLECDVNVLRSLHIAEVNLETTVTKRYTRCRRFRALFRTSPWPRHVTLKRRDVNTGNDIVTVWYCYLEHKILYSLFYHTK